MKNRKKKRKEKKVLGIPVDFDFGKKIKEIKIAKQKYKVFNLISLIVLNVLLIATMIYFMNVINNALVFTIELFTVCICIVWSVLSYKSSVINVKYTIYENAIVKDFDTSLNVGELSKFIGFRVSQNFLDKVGKQKTNTITFIFKNAWCSKISLSCINDNVEEIIDLVIKQAQICRTKSSGAKTSLIEKIISYSNLMSKWEITNNKPKNVKTENKFKK